MEAILRRVPDVRRTLTTGDLTQPGGERAPGRSAGSHRRSVIPGPVAALALLLAVPACTLAPEPLETTAVGEAARAALDSAAAEQVPVTRPIDLAEAMARAVMYNLDARIQRLEETVRSRQLVQANLAMLPALTAGAGYAGRDQFEASYSRSLESGQRYLLNNTSQDRDIFTRDLQLSWNILDLGLSYVRAEQAGDRMLLAAEERRRVMARVVEEVRAAYWRALAAEYVGRELQVLQGRVKGAVEQAEKLVVNGQASPVAALAAQRDLHELTERVQQIHQDVAAARNQLAALMNLPAGTRFSLVRPSSPRFPALPATPEKALGEALRERPEIRAALYGQRVEEREATAALLELLPGITLSTGPNVTSNSYTYANDWVSWGAKASWNLLRLASYPARKSEQKAREDLAAEKLKATVASVALQVHVSRLRYDLARQRAETLARYEATQRRLLAQVQASAATSLTGDNELVREQLNALLSRARLDVAVADAQAAFGGVLTAMGRDPYPAEAGGSLADLANAFRRGVVGPT